MNWVFEAVMWIPLTLLPFQSEDLWCCGCYYPDVPHVYQEFPTKTEISAMNWQNIVTLMSSTKKRSCGYPQLENGLFELLLFCFHHRLTFVTCVCTIKSINLGWIFWGVFRISSCFKSMCIEVMMHLFQTIALFKKFTCYQGCILNICIKYFPSSTSILCKVVTQSSTLQKKKKICLLFSVLSWQIKKQSFQNLRLFFPTNIISDLSIVFSVP